MPAAVLRARGERVRQALARCREGLPPDDAFVALVLDFHETLRLGLAARRYVSRRGPGAAERLALRLERLASRGAPVPFAPGEAASWIASICRPPGGRLLALVWAELEERHGRGRADLEARLFPAS